MTMMNRIRRFALVSVRPVALSFAIAGGSLAVAACGGSVAEQPQTAQGAVSKAPIAQDAHGPLKMIGTALGEVSLRAEQRTEIEKLASDAETRHASGKTARKDLMETVALQVEANKIDRAALQPKIDAVAADMEKARDADRAAFERLHAILDSNQRAAFVSALEANVHGKGHGDDADHKDHAKGGRAGMKQWAEDLKLTDDQKKQIFAAMHDKNKDARHGADHARGDHEGRKEHGAKVMEAFKSDHFVMNEVAPKADVKAAATKMTDRMIGMIETALPILMPEQRTLAAQKIRARATDDKARGL
jgi:Spy/CpxP family protein refolding chaperone